MENNLLENLKTVQGQELKYGKLCEAIGIPKKEGKSKVSQLKDLQMYCDLVKLEKPTRFLVNEVYENEIKAFKKVNGNNKYQTVFDAVIYQAFIENKNQPLYLSTTEMLKLFAEVNENFSYCYNDDQMCRLGEDYMYFSVMGRIAKRILTRWTQSRLLNMKSRYLLNIESAYRLYSLRKGQYGFYRIGHNIAPESEDGQKCLTILAKAYDKVVPANLQKAGKRVWLPPKLYEELNFEIADLTRKEFDEKYCDLKEIMVLLPPEKEWVTDKLTKIYESIPALHEINTEACRKILTTSQLDEFTGVERKRFVDVNMSPQPKISIKEELKRVNQEMEELRKK